jgi:hypothetical protein
MWLNHDHVSASYTEEGEAQASGGSFVEHFEDISGIEPVCVCPSILFVEAVLE